MKFVSNDEAKAWADGWVLEHEADGVGSWLDELERAHLEEFTAQYGRFLAQFGVEYGSLVRLVDELNFVDRTAWPAHRPIQYALLSYNLKTFSSAMDRYKKGYYEDALTLIRGLYETFLRLVFVSCNKDAPWGALGRKGTPGDPDFNVTGLVKDQLKLSWLQNYSVTSAFAHSNVFLVSEALIRSSRREGEPERFGLKLEFDVRLAELVGPLLSFVLMVHLRFAVECLAGEGIPEVPALVVSRDALSLLTYGLESHPQPYWRGVASDLDFLFDLLRVADAGGDWRAMVQSRPAVDVQEL